MNAHPLPHALPFLRPDPRVSPTTYRVMVSHFARAVEENIFSALAHSSTTDNPLQRAMDRCSLEWLLQSF
jgi:hypothetical protein